MADGERVRIPRSHGEQGQQYSNCPGCPGIGLSLHPKEATGEAIAAESPWQSRVYCPDAQTLESAIGAQPVSDASLKVLAATGTTQVLTSCPEEPDEGLALPEHEASTTTASARILFHIVSSQSFRIVPQTSIAKESLA